MKLHSNQSVSRQSPPSSLLHFQAYLKSGRKRELEGNVDLLDHLSGACLDFLLNYDFGWSDDKWIKEIRLCRIEGSLDLLFFWNVVNLLESRWNVLVKVS